MAGNSVQLIGRLTADPELNFTKDGTAVCNFSIALNGRHDEVDYIDVTAWGALGENISEHKHQGDQIAADGRLRQERWETDEGAKRSRVVVVANSVQFLARKRTNGDGADVDEDHDPTGKGF